MLWFVRADTPLWLLRMEPESEAVSLFLKRGGGAKSNAVKVPDLRSRCLQVMSESTLVSVDSITYGLGIGARSSNEEARGMWAWTLGE